MIHSIVMFMLVFLATAGVVAMGWLLVQLSVYLVASLNSGVFYGLAAAVVVIALLERVA